MYKEDMMRRKKSKNVFILSLMPVFMFMISLAFVGAGSVTRSFTSPVSSGGDVQVNLSVLLTGENFYIIEEFFPAEFNFVSSFEGGVNLTANSSRIVFVNYTSPTNKILSYIISAPSITGQYVFRGNYTMGSNVSNVILGSSNIQVVDCVSDAGCNDGVSCTRNLCNMTSGACYYVANDSACSNGLYCDGSESCDVLLDCKSGTLPVIDDNITCTVDTCVESLPHDVHTTNNALCNNGLYCDGSEICDPTNLTDSDKCVSGTPPCISGTESCNEGTSMCQTLLCLLDGIRNVTSEQCDGSDLGGESCVTQLYPTGGILNCTNECTFNVTRCSLLPTYSNFNGLTTNFTNVSNIGSVGNAILENRNYGMIEFYPDIDFSRLDLDMYVSIADKKMFVNLSGTGMVRLNSTSKLIFYNVVFTTPKVLKDGVDCGTSCVFLNWTGGNYSINVSGFSIYEVVEGASATEPPCTSNCGGSGGGGGSGGPPTTPQCRDGRDNDNDGKIDYPNDTGCTSREDNSELDVSEINITSGAFCIENWVCENYTECVNGEKNRTCSDANNCGTTANRPTLSETCIVGGGENDRGSGLNRVSLLVLLSIFGLAVVVVIIILMVKRDRMKKNRENIVQSVKFDQPAIVLFVAIVVFILLMIALGSFSNNVLFSPSDLQKSTLLFGFLLSSALFSFVMWLIVMNRNVKRKKKVKQAVRKIRRKRRSRR